MKPILKYPLAAILFLSFFSLVWGDTRTFHIEREPWLVGKDPVIVPDSGRKDSLHYPFHDRYSDPYNSHTEDASPLYLGNPSNIKTEVEYNPEERQYDINERMGNLFYRNPSYMTFDEFVDNENRKSTRNYFRQRANEESVTQRKGFAPRLYVGGEAFNRIFGGNTIDIRPQGSAELIFGININRYDNPTLPEKQRKTSNFDFKEKIQLSVIGNIGEKLKLSTNYNTEASFDFENKLKLEYTGSEDEIIKKIEAGNVTLPLTGSLIQGSQSLFGIKTQLQFGRLTVTSVFSQQKGKNSTIDVKGGATITPFDIQADQYESNKHFFLAQYFGDHYDQALAGLPFINSQVNITKLEVWVTNVNNTTIDNRSVVALLDLGENNFFNHNVPNLIDNYSPFNVTLPSDSSNTLYNKLTTGFPGIRDKSQVQSIMPTINSAFRASRDFEVVQNAKKLNANEYTFNRQLGYISLNQSLNPNQVLAVAFEYTIGSKVYHVGDLTTSGIQPDQTLLLKLLKGQLTSTQLPTWKLMMKNIYALGGYQIDKKDFKLDVLYYIDSSGVRSNRLPVSPAITGVYGVPLNRFFNLDRVNANSDPRPDGEYDFIEGITINAANGRLIFPVREPFGRYLKSKFPLADSTVADGFAYYALYDSTKTLAAQQQEKNKFSLKGSYSSKVGSDIPLNAINIPEGSVKVTAGGQQLVENVDYTVDYNLGRVKIINQSILASGTSIQISLESNSLFSIQSKTMMGSRFDYIVNKDFTLGGTILRLNERPITQKVNIGDEPISNTIWGVDGTYHTNSRFITKMVDKLPLISTKEPSNVTFSGEFADLIPGNNRAIGKKGTAYIDDFEGSQSTIDLKNVGSWYLASTPSHLFQEAHLDNDIRYGFNRAKMSWYIIDPVFYRNESNGPTLPPDELSNHLVRQIPEKEIFPFKEAPNGQTQTIPVFNLSYYPSERGPYNYDAVPSSVAAGVNGDGSLKNPESRWGGIMRRVETTDFDAANVEFIQFWVMDPFNSSSGNINGGQLYFDIGNISEDILKDGKLSYENGLPRDGDKAKTDTTAWGLISEIQPPVTPYAFDFNANSRQYQDLGLDGLNDADENAYFQHSFFDSLQLVVPQSVIAALRADPSSDDFTYYRNSQFDQGNGTGILDRYKKYSNQQGNSPENSTEAGTSQPDVEDVNRDFNQNAFEQFFEYKVNLTPAAMQIGTNYIVDSIGVNATLPNGNNVPIKWYQFKIPIRDLNAQNGVFNEGGIEGFNTINFIRMFMTGFSEPMTLRFAKLEFLRGEWRKYAYSLMASSECLGCTDESTFDVSTVNLEENGNRSPIPYVIPPGIDQEINVGSTTLQRLNEQSLSLKVCNLLDGDAKAAYKNLQLDLRSYKKLKMYVHAEGSGDAIDALRDGDLTMFIRVGTDFKENYYEYEIPLKVTAAGTSDPDKIWPEQNLLDLDLEKFINLKLARNASETSLTTVYTRKDEGTNNTISIKGNPSLSNARTIMIGIRNPLRDGNNPGTDDGNVKCGEIWVNELRLTDFDKKGGWAASARMQAKLANLGNVAVSATHKSIGFGALEQKVSERRKSDETAFNVASTLYLGKFLPEKTGIDIPMYVNYGTIVSNPQYDPLNEDVPFKTSLATAETKAERKAIKKRSQDYTRTKSINFTNVKKNKTGTNTKSHIYDVENLNFTYAYDELYHRDINIEYDVTKTYRGAVGYNYNTNPKGITPFAKSGAFKSKYARPIKDFNFNLVPSSLNFRAELIRTYGEKVYRNNTGAEILPDTFFNKNFEMRRTYDLRHDITKGLKFDFNANNYSVIDEPDGRIDSREERDSIKHNFWRGGRNKQYQHSGNLNYTVPLSKFPLTDWISVNAKYGFNYGWQAGQFVLDSTRNLYSTDQRTGNTIQNSNTKQLNGNFTMTTLYNKVPFLKKLNSPKPKTPPAPKQKQQPKKFSADSTGVKPPVQKKPAEIPGAVRFMGRMFMGLKTVGLTYTETNGTLLPGYNNYSEILGQDLDKNSPGFGFAFGSQKDIREKSARNGWITGDTSLNNLYTNTYVQNITGRASIEPIDGVKIELTANKNYSQNNSEYFRYNGSDFEHQSLSETGNYSVSWLALNTSFIKDNPDDYSSSVFEEFSRNRIILSERLAALNPNSSGFAQPDSFGVVYNDGYGGTQQEVMTLAFLSAYSGISAEKISLNPFVKVPKPNWRITYDGLSKLPLFKKVFNNVTLSHSYRAAYNINNFGRNLNYFESNGNPAFRDLSNNIVPKKEITQVSISEQFGPLLGVDVTWKNNIQTRVEYRKDRNLSLAFTGAQLTEIKGSEWTFGFGYRLPKFRLPFKIGGKNRSIGGNQGSSLNLTADFSARKNITIIRKLLEGVNEPSGGLNVYSIKVSADYAVNDRLNLRLFYERTINTPVISTSYPTSNTNAGISLRFSLAP